MLNPLAHDFTPISTFSPEAPSSQQPKSPPTPKRKEEIAKKRQTKPKTTASTTTATNTSSTSTSISTAKGKKKDSQANSKKQQQQHRDSKSKHRNTKSTQGTSNHATTATTPSDLFAKESKFITIEAAIDPIRRIKDTSHANSLQHRRQSTSNDKYQFEHGYEQYIDWIERSLRLFDAVTVVGMDNAVVDIVSLVTILQDRRIGVHDDVETFSMDIGNNRITACIQVKLHSFY